VPDVLPRSAESDEPLLPLAAPQAPPAATAALPVLRLRLMGGTQPASLLRALAGVTPAGDAAADLTYDAGSRQVLSGAGDVVAEHVSPASLQGVIDKWRALPPLKTMLVAHPLALTQAPSDARQPEGTHISFTSEPLRYAYVTVLNLQPDGTVVWLYPRADDPPAWPVGEAWQLELQVIPPSGADHLLVVDSAKPLAGLAAQLRGQGSAALPGLLAGALAGMDYRLGLHGLYTSKGE
jgi:hypothetical protein